jgi:hypothetical protein
MKRGRFFAAAVVWGLFSVCVNAAVITVGTGTSTWNYPLSTFYHDGRTQTIYLASEIGGAKTLTSLALDVTTLPGQTMNNFTIRLKHTDLTAYGTLPIWESSGWTTVYQTNQTLSNTGWANFLFTTPFAFNGTQNMMVDMSFDNSLSTSDGYCRYTSSSVNRSIYRSSNSSNGDPLTWTNRTPSPYTAKYFFNIRLGDEVIGTVPYITGMTQESAQIVIPAAGFITGSVTQAYDDIVPIGHIISQSPSAGTIVPIGSAVDMVVSLGQAVTVPDVTGMTQANAQSAIESAGLITGTITSVVNPSVLPGHIISQTPAGGTIVSGGSAVNLVVSLGYYHGGSGTPEDPYQIADVNDLMLLTIDTNSYNKCFILTADIDMSGITGTQYNIIGYFTDYYDYLAFTGTFDGDGHVIRNFTYEAEYKNHAGLFGYLRDGAVIKNLGLEDCAITSTGDHIGTLAGFVYHSTIKNCYATGTLTVGYGSNIGGLVGTLTYPPSGLASPCDPVMDELLLENQMMDSLDDVEPDGIYNCYAAVTITAGEYCSYIGGLAGYQDTDNIVTSYAASAIICDPNCYFVGGLAGASDGVINCFWDTQISGLATSAGGKGRTTVQMQDPNNYVGWNSPENIIWILDEGNDYPRLYWEGTSGLALPAETLGDYLDGEGIENNPFLVENEAQLNLIGLFPENWTQHYQLIADVNCVSITGAEFNRIGANFYMPFGGIFDGNHHSIFNFTYVTDARESNVGLFGYAKNCTIQDLNIENLFVSSPGLNLGGLVGYLNSGAVTSCFAAGNVTGMGTECYYLGGMVGRNSSGTLSKCISRVNVCNAFHRYAGGLLGYNYNGMIDGCHSEGAVSGNTSIGGLVGYNVHYGTISDCSSSSPVTGNQYIGGLAGYHYYYGIITDCHYEGTVMGNTGSNSIGGLIGYCDYFSQVLDSTSAGQVIGEDNIGGLIGNCESGVINNCHSNSTVTGLDGSMNVGGLIGSSHAVVRISSATGNATGNAQIGGLVGYNHYYATLDRCFAAGNAVATTGNFAGGLVGNNDDNCTITQCYATGDAAGRWYVGGLIGYDYHGKVSNCYSTGHVSGVSYLGGLVGSYTGTMSNAYFLVTSGPNNGWGVPLTETNMKIQASFMGWDFTNEIINGAGDIWRICADGVDYPRLNWESIDGDLQCPDGVSIEDLNYFVGQWLLNNCTSVNNFCGGVDVDGSGDVDLGDWAVLAGHWLEGV